MNNLNEMSLADLKTLQKDVGRAIGTFERRRKAEAVAALETAAKEMGFTLAELIGQQPGRRRSIAMAKYANPADPSDTWSGRGRQPHWFRDALMAGRTEQDLLINT
ncbi:transcriptional regulator [Cereibacter changlensis JA139]|uniref:Transcriptional regulator n=2 Tax=Cereibacter changlensis TaxID=402884 RepID=A0A2T4JNP4_9RHOB|nr:H-NS histone family protein [Cereibacter changlensis]PTE19506.1 transcriptional regulator [Cereibacter changlensis JA139]PZX46540.1 DNA-binding protein H-NS [Cereibacter changlensis]